MLYFGVRISTRSLLALVSIVVVTAFFIVVIAKLGSANSVKPFFDMLAVAIGCAVSASRGIFAMARDR